MPLNVWNCFLLCVCVRSFDEIIEKCASRKSPRPIPVKKGPVALATSDRLLGELKNTGSQLASEFIIL